MPAATIVASTRTGAPAASARRPAPTASALQARSARMSGIPQLWIRRSASAWKSAGSRSIGASRRIVANEAAEIASGSRR